VKFLRIKSLDKSVEELELAMQANTIYTYFSSILIDELPTLKNHTIFTDANALNEGKNAYFLGEQLLIGDALILGKEGLQESDVTITPEEVSALLRKDLNSFYKQALAELSTTDINLYRTFIARKADEKIALNCEWVLYTFNIADEKTQEYFLIQLQKTLQEGQDPQVYMEKMASLALNAGG